MSVYQRCKNIQLCRAEHNVRPLFLFSVKSSSLLSTLFTVGFLLCRSIQNYFTLFPSAILFLFLPYFQFLSFQSIEIDNCYIYILYMLTFKFILICHLFVFPNLSVILTSECQRMISIF